MVIYALLLPEIGFVASTFLAVGFLSWRMGATPKEAVVCAVAISIMIYVCFRLVLGLSLAKGPWGF
jgi:putative tricarboxylic transport membrane protein